jgi:hypothetical protein
LANLQPFSGAHKGSLPPVINQDRDLDLETIKRFNFKLPSELDLTDTNDVEKVIEGINRMNTHTN